MTAKKKKKKKKMEKLKKCNLSEMGALTVKQEKGNKLERARPGQLPISHSAPGEGQRHLGLWSFQTIQDNSVIHLDFKK